MTDYKEQNITGDIKSWRRCKKIEVLNPYNAMPSMIFHEEDVSKLPDNRDIKSEVISHILTNFSTPLKEFNLLNPNDNSVIGTAKHQDVYVLLYSLYINLASKRDANELAQKSKKSIQN